MKPHLFPLLFGILSHFPTNAQLPVDREPHHSVILQNDHIRILDGHIRAHDTTPAHLHAANSVVVFLSSSKFAIRQPGHRPVITKVNAGDMKYTGYGDKPVTHVVWNGSPSVFHFFVVELLKTHRPGAPCPALSQPGLQLQWEQAAVRAYYLQPPAGQPVHLPASSCARLLIDVSGTVAVTSSTGTITRQPEGFVYLPPGSNQVTVRGNHSRSILLDIP